MKILAVDSSGLVASAAIVEDGTMTAEYTVCHKKTHSQTLMPMIAEICRMTELDMSSLDALAVAGGPGSFTGLRIGSATVKGLAEALGKPIVSVPTVDALAMNLWGTDRAVVPLMDARRNETYTGIYSFEDGKLEVLHPQCAVPVDEIIDAVNELGRPAEFLGDGIPAFGGQLEEKVRVPYLIAPAHMNKQRAGAVGVLAMQYFTEGRYTDAAEHKPEYLRPSQAERVKNFQRSDMAGRA